MIFALLCSVSFNAAKTPKLNASSKTLTVGKTFLLKVSNANKTVTWSSSNSKIVKIVSKAGEKNYKARIKALKKGNATITAKIGGKNLKCKITVKQKANKKDPTVYVTKLKKGEKYHTSTCRYVKNKKLPVKLSWAKANNYKPCSVCH